MDKIIDAVYKLDAKANDIIFIKLNTMMTPDDMKRIQNKFEELTKCRIVLLRPDEDVVGKIVV